MIRTQALSESRTLRLSTVTLMYFAQKFQLGLMTVALPARVSDHKAFPFSAKA
jgi:hypothetical protein